MIEPETIRHASCLADLDHRRAIVAYQDHVSMCWVFLDALGGIDREPFVKAVRKGEVCTVQAKTATGYVLMAWIPPPCGRSERATGRLGSRGLSDRGRELAGRPRLSQGA